MVEIKKTILLSEYGWLIYITENNELYGTDICFGGAVISPRYRMEKIEDINIKFFSDKSKNEFYKLIEEIKTKYCKQ